jgi:hypothetical protein
VLERQSAAAPKRWAWQQPAARGLSAQLPELHQYLRRLAYEMRERGSCDVTAVRLSTR